MNRKLFKLAIILLFTVAIISACGDKDESKNNDSNEENSQNELNNEEENNADNENDNEMNEDDETNGNEEDNATDMDNDDNELASADSDFAALIQYMEDETEGTAKMLYESDKSQNHDMDGVNVSLDGYTLIELNDFHMNFSIPFNDQTDGGVIIAKYTVKNDTDIDVSYMPSFYMSYVGATKNMNNYRELLPEQEQLPIILSPSNDYELKAGDEVTGYYTYPFGKDQLADVLAEGEADVEVPQPLEDVDDYSSKIGKEGKFTLSLDQESADKNAEKDSQDFYADRVTSENMGDKKMLEGKDGMNKTEALGDVDVTLDGYQFTEFKPNKDEAPRFESFDGGVVLLTVKFDIKNDGKSEIGKNSISSKLTMNDGSQYTLNEGMLLGYKNDDTIEKGDSGELLQVYTLDREQYIKIWKNKSFEVEIGPMKDKAAKDISKGKKVEFKLK